MSKNIHLYKISFIAIIICHMLLNSVGVFSLSSKPTPECLSSILMEASRGQILFSSNPDTKIQTAILPKLMIALMAIDKSLPDTKVTISKTAAGKKSSIIKLEAGEKYTVEELIKIIFLTSADDAFVALSEFVDSDRDNLLKALNNRTKELNMKNTVFKSLLTTTTASQYTTCRDIATFMRHALSNPNFNRLFSMKAEPIMDSRDTKLLVNPNSLFWRYDNTDGGKLELENSGSQSMITTVTRNNQRLVGIIIGSGGDSIFDSTISLLDYGFNNFKSGLLVGKNKPIKTVKVDEQEINLIANEDIYYSFPIGEYFVKQVEYNINQGLKLPLKRENIIGTIKYVLKDSTIIIINLYPDRDVYPTENIVALLSLRLKENRDIAILLIILVIVEIVLGSRKLYKITKKHIKLKNDSTESKKMV